MESEASEQVRQVVEPILDHDHLADEEAPGEITYHDPVLGLTLKGYHELATVREMPALGVVLEWRGSESSGVELLQQSEDLDEYGR
jgi:hypothetical protein